MNADELTKWSTEQVAVLISCGIDPLDAQNTIRRVLAKLPEGQDARTWLSPVPGGNVEISESDLLDARADWYADEDAGSKWKMLLDATETEE